MEVAKINISDELMMALYEKFFNLAVINDKRRMQNIEKNIKNELASWKYENHAPFMIYKINAKIQIPLKIIDEYFELYRKQFNPNRFVPFNYKEYPYISLVSDIATNELKILLTEAEVNNEQVDCDSLICLTDWATFEDKKITFYNSKLLD